MMAGGQMNPAGQMNPSAQQMMQAQQLMRQQQLQQQQQGIQQQGGIPAQLAQNYAATMAAMAARSGPNMNMNFGNNQSMANMQPMNIQQMQQMQAGCTSSSSTSTSTSSSSRSCSSPGSGPSSGPSSGSNTSTSNVPTANIGGGQHALYVLFRYLNLPFPNARQSGPTIFYTYLSSAKIRSEPVSFNFTKTFEHARLTEII